MYPPVDQGAAACDFLCRKCAAQSRNGTDCPEADLNMVNFSQTALLNIITDQIHHVVKTVYNADI